MSERYQQLMKLIVVGESATGKSSLLHRFVEDAFSEDQAQTIGVEFGSKIVELGGDKVKLQIWDTAGQERYKSVTRSYYRGAVGCLIVYDISQRSSYESIPQWLNDVRQLAGKDVVVMLVGNKADLSDGRAVTHNEASMFALENGLLHFETSAATGEFVSEAFLKVARTALIQNTDVADEKEGNAVELNSRANSKKFPCVC
ncbi:ADP ribosylation factor family Ras of Complex Roc domain [Trypanosoma vivax]|nr:ADP ribosylation factor family Ras of Complex Roc domain [Trypanosoma vivax]